MRSIDNYYFVGAGGIGMSALARYYLARGKNVAGYDRTESVLTQKLRDEGADIHYEDDPAMVPPRFRNPADTLVIYTPAVPDTHAELAWFRSRGFRIIKRAELLGEITREKEAICIAGTHGKTTVSSMVAHLLYSSPIGCNAFLGGIMKNYDTNYLLCMDSDYVVVEADEYDRSFHHLRPSLAVITSVSPDHLDIYGSPEAYREAFSRFASLIKPEGALLLEQGAELKIHNNGITVYRYGIEKDKPLDFAARNIIIDNGRLWFDFVTPRSVIEGVELGVPIEINVVNAVAAMAIGWLAGMDETALRKGISSFEGTRRRFDFRIKTKDLVLIDDYAHHPEELEASINSVRKLYPRRRLTVVFQPHLYSRTRDFYRQFAASLSAADEVILLPIYPAREEPIAGVSSQLILDEVTAERKRLVSKAGLLEQIKETAPEALLMAGAGDIELLVEPIVNQLTMDS